MPEAAPVQPREQTGHKAYVWVVGAPKGRLFFQEQIQSQLESLQREKGELERQEREERWICQDYLVGAQCYWEVCSGRVKRG